MLQIEIIIYVFYNIVGNVNSVSYYLLTTTIRSSVTKELQFAPLARHPDSVLSRSPDRDSKFFIRQKYNEPHSCFIKKLSEGSRPLYLTVHDSEGDLKVLFGEGYEGEMNFEMTMESFNKTGKAFSLYANTWEIIIDDERKSVEFSTIPPDSHIEQFVDVELHEPYGAPQPAAGSLNSDRFGTANAEASSGDSSFAQQRRYEIWIVFGSCIMQRYSKMPALAAIARDTPDIVVLAGDNIYLDQIPYHCGICCCKDNMHDDVEPYCGGRCFNWPCGGRWLKGDDSLLPDEEYARLMGHKDWPACEGWNPVWLATWDDHDFGGDNRGGDYDHKIRSKKAFVNFLQKLDEKKHALGDSADWRLMADDDERGIYYDYDHRIILENRDELYAKFILLDVRYHKTQEDILGEDQWRWLQSVIDGIKDADQKPNWLVFVLGTTFLLEHPSIVKRVGAESWPPSSKIRLIHSEWGYDVLARTLILSGDVHFSVVHELRGLTEFTVSAFTHSWDPFTGCFQSCLKCIRGWCADASEEGTQMISSMQRVNGYGLLKLTADSYSFVLKDAGDGEFIPHEKTVQPMPKTEEMA